LGRIENKLISKFQYYDLVIDGISHFEILESYSTTRQLKDHMVGSIINI